ncbi:MAG: TonB-dependent receptor [Bacteroidales bacterium]|nr:TonB-dependent receptor [Bacteroidales bacterium]
MKTNQFCKSLLMMGMLLLGSVLSFAQNRTISGKVTDANGDPIPGVAVVARTGATAIGQTTDLDGRYTISVPASVTSLTFTMLSYEDAVETIGGRSVIDVVMKDSSLFLDEAVSIGYAKVKRKDLTGSSVSVTGNDLAQVPVTTAAQALTGKAAGVNITTQSGAPGAEINITVRGGNSITQSTTPLYIVDGFAMEDGLRMVDINDIESIDVLKDASATAIYGAQGSNGVILITTKSGKAGKTQVTYNAYGQFEQISKTLPMLGVEDYVKYQYEFAMLNTSGKIDAWADMFGGSLSDPNFYANAYSNIHNQYGGKAGIDWQDLVFGKTAFTQSHNVNVTGGNEKTRFMLSYNFNDQDGIMAKHGYKRNAVRAKINHELWKGVRLDFNTAFSSTNVQGGGRMSSALRKTLLQPPTGGVRFTDDDLINKRLTEEFKKIEGQYDLDNPILENEAVDNNSYNRQVVLNGGIEIDFLPNLTWRTAGSYTWNSIRSDYWDNGTTRAAESYKTDTQDSVYPYGSRANTERYTWQITNTLNYNTSFGKSTLNALLGQETVFNHSQNESNVYYGFPENNFGLNNVSMAQSYSRSSGLSENAIVSFFGRLMYNYDDRYLLTVSARADGTSKFAKGHKWGFFPSASAAWRISQEDFYKDSGLSNVINRMKLRIGYGTSGNCNVEDYIYTTAYGAGHYAINNTDVSTLVPSSTLGNPDLKWETTTSFNVGLDLGLARDRVNLSADWYNNQSNDLIILNDIPNTTGYTTQYQNLGSIRNRGVEIVLNTVNIDGKDFRWTTDFNVSFNRSKVLSLYGQGGKDYMYASRGDSYENWSAQFLVKVGQPIGQFFGYVYDGVYTTDDFTQNADGSYILKPGIPYDSNRKREQVKPGDMKFVPQTDSKDAEGNPTYKLSSDADRAVVGNSNPLFSGGLSNTFTYKGFDLSVFMNFSVGNRVWNLNKVRYYGPYLGNMNAFGEMAGRFTLIDPATGKETTDLARLAELNPNQHDKNMLWSLSSYNNYSVSCPMDLFSEDASFLRLATITLGYTLPKDLTRKAHIEGLRFYVTLNNLYTFTKYTGYDPEVSTNGSIMTKGVDSSSFPKTRGCVLGINLNF